MKFNKKIVSLVLSLLMLTSIPACTDAQKSDIQVPKTQATVTKADDGAVQLTNLSESDKKLIEKNSTKEYKQVLENIRKALDEVDCVTTKYDVQVSEANSTGEMVGHKNVVSIANEISYQDEKDENENLKIDKMYDHIKMDQVEYEDYLDMKNKKVYVKPSGKDSFEEYVLQQDDQKTKKQGADEEKDEPKMDVETESSYIEAVKAFLFAAGKTDEKTSKPFFTMNERDTTYDFNFKGQNDSFIYMIDGLFGLGMNGLMFGQAMGDSPEAIADISYSFSKIDYSMVAVSHTLKQSAEGKNYISMGQFTLQSKDDDTKLVNLKKLSDFYQDK